MSIESCIKNKFMQKRLSEIIIKTVDNIKPKSIIVCSTSVVTDIYSIFKYAVDNNNEIQIPNTLMKERNKKN